MSRIGKLPITLPEGVTLTQTDQTVTVTGPKGELSLALLPAIKVEVDSGMVSVKRRSDGARAIHGLTRQLLANMVKGVSEGFEKRLELKGIGYRATTEGENKLILSVGYSHPVTIEAPDHVVFRVEKNVVVVSGLDKQVVGEIAAKIRRVRPPEPYKGKGIMYAGELIRRKAGKAAKTTVG